MIQHFQFKSLYSNAQLPGWSISFYFAKERIEGIYHPDGRIEWATNPKLEKNLEDKIKKQIHDLMLYHVYDNR